jgi:transaldolase/glucose-6-phosphate isomerase
VQDAADVLRHAYAETRGAGGYVSLGVSPALAADTEGMLSEAHRLWKAVERENLMIKVPATAEGIAALRQLVSEGINVEATLVFGRETYQKIAEAYLAGLESFAARGGDPARVAAVASFFVGRIDSAIEALVADRLKTAATPRERALLRSLAGKVGIASAKLTYQRYQELFAGPRWQALADRGAHPARLLWASTGPALPGESDVAYVEALAGPDTVAALAPPTVDAFRDHGRPRASLTEHLDDAHDVMASVAELGISMGELQEKLLHEGLHLLGDAFDKLIAAVARECREAWAKRINPATYALPDGFAAEVRRSLAEWQASGKARRLWQRDPSLWSGRDEAQWLGWLSITNEELAHIQRFGQIADVARSGDFSAVLLLGMGGSSLGPEVLRQTFGKVPGFPDLHILDSTDPAQVRSVERAVDLARTLFVVSSKSGSTLEPNIFKQYFFDRVVQAVGPDEAGRRFVTITDPHSKMEHVAEADGFRRIFFGWPNIGGRYSVLSDFGLVPAAAMGVNVADFLDRTEAMVYACMPSVPVDENPGVVLGTILGVGAKRFGRDKLTIFATPGITSLGAWLEQLVAESTGKEGHGVIPIDRETPMAAELYAPDRLFVFLRLDGEPENGQAELAAGLERTGHPVVRIRVQEHEDLGQEFFRWEVATAVAGSILGIDPFDQPDVEASKIATRKLTTAYEERGSLPAETPIFEADGVRLYTDPRNAEALAGGLGGPPSLTAYLGAHLRRLGRGDYFALLAYVEMNEAHARELQAIRDRILTAARVATCLEFGPRFLHSTGQGYKGGPNTGVFLQLTCDDAADLPVPGQKYTFGVVKAAQARGDFDVLVQRGRRALRVHLGPDVAAGLATLKAAVFAALGS